MGIIDKEIYVMGGDLGGLLLRMHWYYIDFEILADFLYWTSVGFGVLREDSQRTTSPSMGLEWVEVGFLGF